MTPMPMYPIPLTHAAIINVVNYPSLAGQLPQMLVARIQLEFARPGEPLG